MYVLDCNPSATGSDYIGHTSVTVTGRKCQAWASNHPHRNDYNHDHLYPDGNATKARNYCRNPAPGRVGLWCYTMDSSVNWEKCDVPTCGE